ncbi:helix-turn-helix domain-containing protein, partial [Collinsella sp. HCP3S3_A7]
MLERRASCREIARELGRSPSTVSAEVASHRFVTAPKARRGERVDASADLSAACPRLAAWPRCCNGCGRYVCVKLGLSIEAAVLFTRGKERFQVWQRRAS